MDSKPENIAYPGIAVNQVLDDIINKCCTILLGLQEHSHDLTLTGTKSLQMSLDYQLKIILDRCINKDGARIISLNESLESQNDFLHLFTSKLIEVKQEFPELGENRQVEEVVKRLNQSYIFGRDQIQMALDEVNTRPMPQTINYGIHFHFDKQ